mgnify:CR=1 FL=1
MDKFFKISERGSNVRTEIVGGITTFFAMAYIIFVNPNTLCVNLNAGTGNQLGEIMVSWCISIHMKAGNIRRKNGAGRCCRPWRASARPGPPPCRTAFSHDKGRQQVQQALQPLEDIPLHPLPASSRTPRPRWC